MLIEEQHYGGGLYFSYLFFFFMLFHWPDHWVLGENLIERD